MGNDINRVRELLEEAYAIISGISATDLPVVEEPDKEQLDAIVKRPAPVTQSIDDPKQFDDVADNRYGWLQAGSDLSVINEQIRNARDMIKKVSTRGLKEAHSGRKNKR